MIRLREWDYMNGEFSYGQRLGVGDIFQDENLSEYQRLKAAWKELYGWSLRLMLPFMRARRVKRMLDGIKYWADVESKTLNFEPDDDAKKAGIALLSEEVGTLGTVKALAEKFKCDPDVILGWQWGKVYGILYTDLKEYEYHRRLDKVLKRKSNGRGRS